MPHILSCNNITDTNIFLQNLKCLGKLTNIRWCPLAPPMLIAAAILVLMHDYPYYSIMQHVK